MIVLGLPGEGSVLCMNQKYAKITYLLLIGCFRGIGIVKWTACDDNKIMLIIIRIMLGR